MPATAPGFTVHLHRAQMAFRRSTSLYRGFVGGRGAGKTHVGAYDLIRRAKRGRTYLVASPTGVLMGDTTFPTFKQVARSLNVLGTVKLTPYPNVELTTGATVRFRTAEDPERLRGPNLSGVWLDEASLMDREAYNVCIAALREGGEQGWLSATFTPKGKLHWTYEVFGRGRVDTELFQSPTRDNPFLPPNFAETVARQYPSELAAQELGGEFVLLGGARFKPHWFRRYDDGGDVWLCEGREAALVKNRCDVAVVVDPANRKTKASKYTAIGAFAFGPKGEVVVVEVWREQLSVEQIVPRLNAFCARHNPSWVGIEANGFQIGLVQQARDRARYPRIPAVYELDHGGKGKLTRATPAIIKTETGLVYVPRDAPWVEDYLSELCQFTGDEKQDAFSDQTDITAYAVLGAERFGPGRGGEPLALGGGYG